LFLVLSQLYYWRLNALIPIFKWKHNVYKQIRLSILLERNTWVAEWGQENVGVILKFNLRERKDALGAQYKINQKFDQIYRLIFSRFYLYQSSYYRFLVKASLVIKVKIVHYIQTKKLSTVQKCLSWKIIADTTPQSPKKSSTFAPPLHIG